MNNLHNDIREVILAENPDAVTVGDRELAHYVGQAVAFGKYKDEYMFVGDGGTHADIVDFNTMKKLNRRKLKYAGRFWLKSKIITFWEYPPHNKLKSEINAIQKDYNDDDLAVDGKVDLSKFKIELPPQNTLSSPGGHRGELVPIKQALTGKGYDLETSVSVDTGQDHIKSPTLKSVKKLTSKQKLDLYNYFKAKGRLSPAEKQMYKVINRENMIREEILKEANPVRDRAYVKIARDVHKNVQKWLKDKEEQDFFSRSKQFAGFAIGLDKIPGIKKQYHNVLLILGSSKKKPSGGIGDIKIKNYRHVIVNNVLISDYNLKHADTRFRKDVFIHEFIHYLDTFRDKGKKTGSADKFRSGGDSEYYNDESEFNAFYQEGLASLIGIFDGFVDMKIDHLLDRYFDGDFKQFKKHAISFFNQDFVSELNNKNEKKFLKRLYQSYTDLKKKYS